MSLILIAGIPEAAVSLKRILQGHELIIANTMQEAQTSLLDQTFDLIIVSLHFDESRMFEFMRKKQTSSKNVNSPLICFCARETNLAHMMHGSLEFATRVLGALTFLNQPTAPDYELRRVIESCLAVRPKAFLASPVLACLAC
jgi:DNA-binding response OmpR family regulator